MENNKVSVCNEDSSSSVSMSIAGGPRRCSGTRSVSPGHNGGGGGVVTPTSSLRSTPSPSVLPVSAPPAQQQQLPPNKIISRNVNGTVAVTTIPTNEAELQLYRVMQRASLLSYYDTLLEMGGDDVQQLCDAGEEEFLEIMALIGMASKPLHVRRLQKALQEWMANPALFQIPVISLNYGPGDIGASTANSRMLLHQATLAALQRNDVPDSKVSRHSPTPRINDYPKVMHAPIHGTIPKTVTQNRQQDAQSPVSEVATSSCTVSSNVSGSPTSTPALTDLQITQITDNAERLTKLLPRVEPKHTGTKKKICKDLEHVMQMREDDPRRMDEIRRYAAIYGRFDCKRRSHKPLTLHEVLVNEAAAQICRRVPALLTRRDELFPLARQLVRDVDAHRYHADTMSPARTRSMSTNSSDSETSASGGDSKPKSPRSIDSSPGR